MSLLTLTVLAFGMSMDAFSAAIAKGVATNQMSPAKAVRYGVVFGLVEAVAPVIGWFVGIVAHQWIQSIDHWIAFVLLTALGVRCIYESCFASDQKDEKPTTQNRTLGNAGLLLFITAVATSIDATVIGISLAFLQINIYVAAILIGIITTIMATVGLLLGQRLGIKFGQRAMLAGGIMLIMIGASILYSHLMV